ncbi:putative Zinc finger and BTB domain-containing protein 41 [Hypsibius exemplaris]|uniref:Zinc finger and BTB domain-containing protein 41 n=1 Tax=Hypsibius exemplaris TaxID=2072580 RepID=A0A1W0WMF3_HYPEX|nr:putative Zinc finger and BTB domain-containing protein 41 [Hypsibius exemplaris]
MQRVIRPKDPRDGSKWCHICNAWKKEACGIHIVCGSGAPSRKTTSTSPPSSRLKLPPPGCDVCKVNKDGPCVIHTDAIADRPVVSFAMASLPDQLEIKSVQDVNQKGVFSRVDIWKPTIFGPLVGLVSNECDPSVQFALQLKSGLFECFRLESDDHSNWMKFVRSAGDAATANLSAFQQDGHVYFVSVRPLSQGDELRVGYLGQYAAIVEQCRKTQTLPPLADVLLAPVVPVADENLLLPPPRPRKRDFYNSFLPGGEDGDDPFQETFTPTGNSMRFSSPSAELNPDRTVGVDAETESAEADANRPSSSSPRPTKRRRLLSKLPGHTFTVPASEKSARKPRSSGATFGATDTTEDVLPVDRRKKSAVFATETKLRLVDEINPFQYPEGPACDPLWRDVLAKLGQLGCPTDTKARHALKVLVARRITEYRERVKAAAGNAEEEAQLREKFPLDWALSEKKSMQKFAKKPEKTADEEAAAIEEAVETPSTDEQMTVVLDINPYQFPVGDERNDAWTRVFEQVGLTTARARRLLQSVVARRVRDYRKKLSAAATPEDKVSVRQQYPLDQRLMECKEAQGIVPGEERKYMRRRCLKRTRRLIVGDNVEARVDAVIRAAAERHPCPSNVDFWSAVYGKLVVVGGIHDPDTDDGGVEKLRKWVFRHTDGFQHKLSADSSDASMVFQSELSKLDYPFRPKYSTTTGGGTSQRRKRMTTFQRQTRVTKAGYKSSWWRYRCDICTAEFRTQPLLTLHGVKHGRVADTAGLSTTCPACEVTHASLDELMVHIERHERRPSVYHKATPFQCTTCLRYYSSQEFLDRHIRRIHTDSGGADRQFECATCREKYFTLAALRSHERSTPPAIKFPEFHQLRRHLRVMHTNQQTFTCQVCQRVLRRKLALDRHMLVHEAKYAFACETCGRRFKRLVNLQGHRARLHHPDRQYVMKERSEKVAAAFATAVLCEFCTRQYSSRDRLLIHQREKHLEKMPVELRFPKGPVSAAAGGVGDDGGALGTDNDSSWSVDS